MYYFLKKVSLITLFLFLLSSVVEAQMTASTLIKLMSDATSKTMNYEYTMVTSERLMSGKGYHNGKSFNRIQMPNFNIF